MLPRERMLASGGRLRLFDPWLPSEEATAAFDELRTTVPWESRSITLFGRTVPQPRLVAWFGDEGAVYTYSGLTLQPTPWTPLLAALRRRAEAAAGAPFNSVLLNLYRSGQDSMGFHADDEPELGPEPVIASVSLGVTRKFQVRAKKKGTAADSVDLLLPHGSLLVMDGTTQRFYRHGVPKEPRVHDARINLTFRFVRRCP